MQSTFATNASLRLTYPLSLTVEQTQGATVGLKKPVSNGQTQELTVSLGSIQYGQSRDVYLRYTIGTDAGSHVLINTDLEYDQMTEEVFKVVTWCNLADGLPTTEEDATMDMLDNPPLTPGERSFHISRSMLCSFLSSLFPMNDAEEHQSPPFTVDLGGERLTELIKSLPAAAPEHASDVACAALMVDINGQVRMALSQPKFYARWGKHYLPSLECAHATQQCNSFKDAGPLLYAASSPLFIACRDALDTAFDTIPAPKPSKKASTPHRLGFARRAQIHGVLPGMTGMMNGLNDNAQRGSHPAGRIRNLLDFKPTADDASAAINMRSYHNSRGPCFASFCRVTLADGKHIRVNRLRGGMRVQTPRGPRTVAAVMKTPVSSIPMVTIGRLLITAWHPVSHNGAHWVFPCRDPAARKNAAVRYTGSIYSVLLQPDEDADAHAISIEGIWVVTLGHGLTEKEDNNVVRNDARVHRFFGDYSAVCRSMATLDVRKDGLVVNGGSSRSNFRLWHTRK